MSAEVSEMSILRVETVLRLGRDALLMFKRLRSATNEYAPRTWRSILRQLLPLPPLLLPLPPCRHPQLFHDLPLKSPGLVA